MTLFVQDDCSSLGILCISMKEMITKFTLTSKAHSLTLFVQDDCSSIGILCIYIKEMIPKFTLTSKVNRKT